MATYVMSDIHGYYITFLNMLEKINLNSNDTLYVLGDVIDRGKDGVLILKYIMGRPNIKMILGNHEYMCLNYFAKNPDTTAIRRWNRNGNFNTLVGFDELNETEKEEILSFISNLKGEIRLEVNGMKFILVHGFLGEDLERQVWNRPKKDEKVDLENNEVIIIGHTPVCEYVCPGSDEDIYIYSRKLTDNNDHFRIFHSDSFIDIDCCIGYGFSAARLACLRLDDMKEFYEKVID